MRRLLARHLPGIFVPAGGQNQGVLVEAEVPKLLWLIGSSSDEELVIVGAWDVPGPALGPAAAEGLLPGGLRVVGLFARDAASAADVPQEVSREWRGCFEILAARAEDGGLAAWALSGGAAGQAVGPWSLEASSPWARECVRGRFTVSVPGESAFGNSDEQELERIAAGLHTGLRFRFPGSSAAPTLEELRGMKPPVPLKVAGDGMIAVDVLAADCGAAGHPTNFAVLDAKLPATYEFDFAAYLAPGTPAELQAVNAASALVAALKRQLASVKHFAAPQAKGGERTGLSFGTFAPAALGHVVSLPGTGDRGTRQSFHKLLRLPAAPLLLPESAAPWAGAPHPRATGKPVNPHAGCPDRPSWWKGSDATTRTVFVKGLYEYSHYMQDQFDDNGWGCAYRSLQTCISWYRMQFYAEKEVPGILDIQKLLKRIDEAKKDIVIGSKEWIGTIEGMYLLQDYLGVDCRLEYCQESADFLSKAPQFMQHFETEGTPIMMGAGEYAYTLVGLCFDSASGDVAFMIVDPHYTGADTLKTILQKGWVGWKNMEFFEKSTHGGFINCCLPMVPKGAEHM